MATAVGAGQIEKRAVTETSDAHRTQGAHLAYLPGLDGLRALAVTAVLLYHAYVGWLPGGFLGVEAFFVLSGYLITSLLLVEWQRTGSIDLRAFWLRRARRLLPALFLLLLGVVTFAVIFLPGEVAGMRGDVPAALGYVTNWFLVFSRQSYFQAMGRPSLLQHLWSLAVEEQFYLIWPLLFVVGLKWVRRPRALLPLVLAGAAGSTLLMAWLYQPDADPSRVYYGTDTRAAGLLIGCALALIWAPQALRSRGWWARAQRTLLDLAGVAALLGLAWIAVVIDENQPLLYQGGFAVIALLTALAVASVVHPSARVMPALLGLKPLRWIGRRSYGIYLWHWPIFDLTRPQQDVQLEGLPLLALRFGLTLAAAELSFRFVETPVRHGALGRAWSRLRHSEGAYRSRLVRLWTGAALASVLCAGILGAALVEAQEPPLPDYLSVSSISIDQPLPTPTGLADDAGTQPSDIATALAQAALLSAPSATPDSPDAASAASDVGNNPATEVTVEAGLPLQTAVPTFSTATEQPSPDIVAENNDSSSLKMAAPLAPGPAVAVATSTVSVRATATVQHIAATQATPRSTVKVYKAPTSTPAPPLFPVSSGVRVTAIGDSVMIGAAGNLARVFGNINVDAVLGRQVSQGIAELQSLQAAGKIGSIVIVHLGTNGTFTAKQFDQIMQVLGSARRIFFLNDKAARSWETTNNAVITAGVQRYPNTRLVNWRAASIGHAEFFWNDLIHLRPTGAQFYAQLIAATVSR